MLYSCKYFLKNFVCLFFVVFGRITEGFDISNSCCRVCIAQACALAPKDIREVCGRRRQVNRVLGFALNSKKLKDKLMDTSQLISEINIEYARTMNKIVFDDSMSRPEASQKMLVQAEDFPLPPKPPVPEAATVAVPEYDFAEQFSEFSFYTCLTKSEVIVASTKVRALIGATGGGGKCRVTAELEVVCVDYYLFDGFMALRGS